MAHTKATARAAAQAAAQAAQEAAAAAATAAAAAAAALESDPGSPTTRVAPKVKAAAKSPSNTVQIGRTVYEVEELGKAKILFGNKKKDQTFKEASEDHSYSWWVLTHRNTGNKETVGLLAQYLETMYYLEDNIMYDKVTRAQLHPPVKVDFKAVKIEPQSSSSKGPVQEPVPEPVTDHYDEASIALAKLTGPQKLILATQVLTHAQDEHYQEAAVILMTTGNHLTAEAQLLNGIYQMRM
jgi:hypothetical protein